MITLLRLRSNPSASSTFSVPLNPWSSPSSSSQALLEVRSQRMPARMEHLLHMTPTWRRPAHCLGGTVLEGAPGRASTTIKLLLSDNGSLTRA